MDTGMPRRELTDLEAVKALAHPRRQQIVEYLTKHGPATSAVLARALGLNTGATSYHLRELAKHGFIEEVAERARGRERWWRSASQDIRFPRRSEQGPELRRAMAELERLAFARDLEAFSRFQVERDELGEWSDALPYSRGLIWANLAELEAFFEDYIALLKRYQRSAETASPGARMILTRFLAFPAPTTDEDQEDHGDQPGRPPPPDQPM
jgi:DNA-binding transcriptional ArsR family regulator